MGRLGPPFFSCLGGIISSFTEQGLYDFDVERESDGIFRLNGPAASEGCSARDARRFSPEFHRVLLFLRHELRQLFALPRANRTLGCSTGSNRIIFGVLYLIRNNNLEGGCSDATAFFSSILRLSYND